MVCHIHPYDESLSVYLNDKYYDSKKPYRGLIKMVAELKVAIAFNIIGKTVSRIDPHLLATDLFINLY